MSLDTVVIFGNAEREWARLGRECMGEAGGEPGGELAGVDIDDREERGDGLLYEAEDEEGVERLNMMIWGK